MQSAGVGPGRRLSALRSRHVLTFAGLLLAGGGVLIAAGILRTANQQERLFGELAITVGAIILLGRAFGAVLARVGQPRVMGEVIAGILLGPTLVGALPDLLGFEAADHWPFSGDGVTALKGIADIGLAFYMFLVGIELDPGLLKGRLRQAAVISISSIALPFVLGIGAALFILNDPHLLQTLAGPAVLMPGAQTAAPAFAVFIGVSMSITAFPVLARILLERGLLRRPVGALALASAAIDDIAAWSLLALAVALAPPVAAGASAVPRGPLDAVGVVVLAGGFAAVMWLLARPLLTRVSDAYDEAGHIPGAWLITILVGVLVAAFAAQQVGVAAIFGAFVMGVIMPRRRELTLELSRRIEDFVVIVLLPVFFVIAGQNADIGALLADPALWVVTIALTAVAVVGKFVGATVASRVTGSDWRTAGTIGALMNTRGLTELIVLLVGFNAHVISEQLFSALVVMAIVTTLMTGPLVRMLQGRQAALPVEAELAPDQAVAPGGAAARQPRPILICAQDERNLDALAALGEPLARAGTGRTLIVAMIVTPPAVAAGLVAINRELLSATRAVNAQRLRLTERGVAARSLAFTSAHVGGDIVRLAAEHDAELVLLDGRRSLLGDGLPAGAVATVLQRADCDVAVLIERPNAPPIGPSRPVLVPFGGAEHDWAALEVAAGLAGASSAALRLLAVATGEPGDEGGPTRLLAAASLVVQRTLGVAAESVVVRDRQGLLEAAAEAGLLVIGLSDRWRQEGLGRVRAAIAEAAPAPILFVRRGRRPGGLAPESDVTRFRWSVIGSGTVVSPPQSTTPSITAEDAIQG